MIERVCLENGYYYIENRNVYENDLRIIYRWVTFTKFWHKNFTS